MFPIDKNKNFKSDLSIIVDKLRNREKFSFSKYADGEMAILVDSQITNCDGWTFLPNEHKFYRDKLIESFQYQDSNYFVGIGCPCCMGQESFEWMRDNSYQNPSNLTWANIFVNSNFTEYVDKFIPLYNEYDIILVANHRSVVEDLPFDVNRFYGIGDLAWKDDYNLIDRMKEDIDKEDIKDSLFLFCAGPLGNMLSHQLFEHNKNNTYIDIGSTLNVMLGAGKNRGYLNGMETLNKICVWG